MRQLTRNRARRISGSSTRLPIVVAIQRLPAEAEKISPQLQGYSYLAVEELVAIVDTDSRKVVIAMQRVRRQEITGSGN